jgi:hypothetical protein
MADVMNKFEELLGGTCYIKDGYLGIVSKSKNLQCLSYKLKRQNKSNKCGWLSGGE